MAAMGIQTLLSEFGKTVGIPDLCFDENGYCCLFFDDMVVNMELAEDGDHLFLYSNVGEIPEGNLPAFYEMLLEGNYFFRKTRGATLGIDRDANIVLLIYRRPTLNLELSDFEQLIENFVNVTESWTRNINGFEGSAADPADGSGDDLMPGIRV